MTIRASARIAGFAILAAEAAALGRYAGRLPKPGVWTVLLAVQVVAFWWATDRRSVSRLRTAVPAALIGVAVAAVWTAFAFVVPVITTGDAAALAAIVGAGLVVASVSRHDTGHRLLSLVLLASSGTALLIFLVIEVVLPGVPGFVSNSHPPIYTPVTRMVDPIGEFGIFALLVVALGVVRLRARVRRQRGAAGEQRYGTGLNEMVVERSVGGVQPASTEGGQSWSG